MKQDVLIRDEAPGDADAIRAMTAAAFAKAARSSGGEAGLVEALRTAGALTLSLVAVEIGAVIGHVAFSPVRIDGAALGWFGLGPVSVRPDRQGAGVGASLIRTGLARLRANRAAGCVVLGAPDYYGRFGFVADPGLRYPAAPAQYFQRLVFEGFPPGGEVAYHPAFDNA